jgi:hypothetical protein
VRFSPIAVGKDSGKGEMGRGGLFVIGWSAGRISLKSRRGQGGFDL